MKYTLENIQQLVDDIRNNPVCYGGQHLNEDVPLQLVSAAKFLEYLLHENKYLKESIEMLKKQGGLEVSSSEVPWHRREDV